jgi:hypothetical protein
MIVNFRNYKISWGTRKLTQTLILSIIIIKKGIPLHKELNDYKRTKNRQQQ